MEIAKQKLELANKELESKDKIIEQMNETIDILKWRVEVQESMTSQIKDIADRLFGEGGEGTGFPDRKRRIPGKSLKKKLFFAFGFYEWQNQSDLVYRLVRNTILSGKSSKNVKNISGIKA